MGFSVLVGPGGAGAETPVTGSFKGVEMVRDAVRAVFVPPPG
jgi:hypothetical protein